MLYNIIIIRNICLLIFARSELFTVWAERIVWLAHKHASSLLSELDENLLENNAILRGRWNTISQLSVSLLLSNMNICLFRFLRYCYLFVLSYLYEVNRLTCVYLVLVDCDRAGQGVGQWQYCGHRFIVRQDFRIGSNEPVKRNS